jgi:CheY-like chemotaxis protein
MESTSPTRPQVVLIAEDDPGSLMALPTCLELEGYAAVPATDGETALACYDERGGQLDFVITDFGGVTDLDFMLYTGKPNS